MIEKIIIDKDCTSCGVCETVCPWVFVINDISEVREDVDFNEYEDSIRESVEYCPVEVISLIEKNK